MWREVVKCVEGGSRMWREVVECGGRQNMTARTARSGLLGQESWDRIVWTGWIVLT